MQSRGARLCNLRAEIRTHPINLHHSERATGINGPERVHRISAFDPFTEALTRPDITLPITAEVHFGISEQWIVFVRGSAQSALPF